MHFRSKKNLPKTLPKRGPNPSKIDAKNRLFLPVQAAGAGDRVLGCIRPVGRRTKRNETKWNEARKNERNEKNETRRIFRIAEVACDLQSLDAFFLFTFGRHFGVLARLHKMSTAPCSHYFGSFFSCEKSQSFVAIWNDFPNLAQFFERPTLVDQSSANSSRLLTKLSGMLRFGVRFSRRTF